MPTMTEEGARALDELQILIEEFRATRDAQKAAAIAKKMSALSRVVSASVR